MSDSEDSDTAIVARNRKQQALFRAEQSSSPVRQPAAAKARRAPRFLGDGESPAKSNGAADALDDLFGNLDDVPNVAIPARLDKNALNRVLNSASADAAGGSTAEGGAGGDDVWNVEGGEVDGVVQKKRKVLARMDETRLLGPSGFPKLIEDVQKFKFKGKGREAQDLKRLMSMYQLWAHQMYPKTNLRDTLKTVEKLCHKRGVQRALRQYREDQKHGKDASAPEGAAAAAAFSDEEDDGLGLAAFGAPRRVPAPAAAPKPKPPPVVIAGADGMDDFDDLFADEDELLAELDMESGGAGRSGPASKPKPTQQNQEQTELDDDEAMLALAEAEGGGGYDEDEEAERAMREMEDMM